jgi:hypothetical protein
MLYYIIISIIFLFLFYNLFYINEHLDYDNLSISSIHKLTPQQIYNIPPSETIYKNIIPNLTKKQLVSLPTNTLNIIAGFLSEKQIDFMRNYQKFKIRFSYRKYNMSNFAKSLTIKQIKNLPPHILFKILPYLSNSQITEILKV